MSRVEKNKTVGELKVNINKVDYEVLNITVLQNLSCAQHENGDISDYPVILQTNGKMLT